jgi:rhodanese-related sulfurtransferase/DNA-binding transcriptional ArsR family regulator
MSRHVTRGHEAKRELFDAFASVAKVLSSGTRAEIVDVLAQGERPVDEISREIDQTIANTSQHLQQLLRAGLVKTRRDGTRIYYSLSGPAVSRLWAAVRDVAAEHVAKLDELAASYLGDRSTLTTMTRTEVYERIGGGDLVVIDVRPEAEFRAGHIAGATSVTLKELEKWLDELPNDRLVVAYCRGPYCVFADNAVRTLSRHGFKAARLEEGYPEWKEAGLPVEANTTDMAGHDRAS